MKKATVLGEQDLYLFNEGTHVRLHDKLGSRLMEHGGKKGSYFALWAPNAEHVSVIGDFNGWDARKNRLHPRESSGIWEGFIEGVGRGALYKYHITGRRGYRAEKADPFAVRAEAPPKTASIVWGLDYEWGDGEWMRGRKSRNALEAPISIYEVHLGSWRKGLSYREAALQLAEYALRMGFTHVEFLPVMEHPFGGSWGYQITGYYAPTARFGIPQDFMFLVDTLHQAGIGVILDWVPSHFPSDGHGLACFDGTCLYEHADPRQGFHPDWKSAIFNYGRNEVRSFLISNALYWLEKYHADILRVDAVASMLYLDYSRREGEWVANAFGGRENLEAVDFLRRFNREVYRAHPEAQTIAEESTAWQMVSRPVDVGGLGFGLKWDMGWMHDTLGYLRRDPVHRKHHQNEITFRMLYAFRENFCLPLSHDEVVHGKGSLLERMPGDDWQKFANLRLLYAYQFAQPGKKLLFMGGELAQRREWDHDGSLDWDLLRWPAHRGMQALVERLNRLYREQPALHQRDCQPEGFEWIDCGDADNSVIAFLRKGKKEGEFVAAICNFTPVPRQGYRVGLPRGGRWREILNTDAVEYGGSGAGNLGGVEAKPAPAHGRSCSIELILPPLAALYFTNA